MINIQYIEGKAYLSNLWLEIDNDIIDDEETFDLNFFIGGNVNFFWVQRQPLPLEESQEKVKIERIIAFDLSEEGCIHWYIFHGVEYPLERIAPSRLKLMVTGIWRENHQMQNVRLTGFDCNDFFKEITECFDDLNEVIKATCIEKRLITNICQITY